MDDLSLFDHVTLDHHVPRTLFLLPGTGGDKNDLLFFDQLLNSAFTIISLTGNVREQGMPRFFDRIGPGVFDQDSITQETEKLQRFVKQSIKEYSISLDQVSFLGYSNGANMILALALRYPQLVPRAALLHSMLPFPITKSVDLSNHQFLVTMGSADTMIPPDQQHAVVTALQSQQAQVTVKEYPCGHEVSDWEIHDAVAFLLQTPVN